MYKPFLLIAFMCMISFTKSQKLNLIPYPQKVEIQEYFYTIPKEIIFEKGISKENYELYRSLFEKHYINTEISSDPKKSNISFRKPPSKTNSKKGFYQLNLLPSNTVQIYSYDDTGSFYAIQTLLQLIATSENGKIPSLEMTDEPKFDYRGMHLDVSRHFFSAEEVKKYLDYLAAYKYNKFHWHLTDDQGWRIEIKKYPKLTEIGAFRNGSQVGPYSDLKFDTIRYGGFYTQQEIKDIVAYAKALHIDIIPEIEMPGHSVAAIASYPELSCLKGNFEVSQKWGVEENILCPSEYTFKFLENVLDEIIELFPYEYIHIGGDEAPKTVWKESEFVQKKIKELGLKDEHEMQSYFITRIEKYLNSKGRKIIGWDEILEGGLAPNATVMSWTGEEGGIEAAKSRHKAIMTPVSTNYFDHYQGDPKTEPLAFGGNTRLDKVYHYEPVPKELNAEEAKYIWGSQGNVWTEYIPNFKQVEYMIFPRMMALSEVVWGTAKADQYENFLQRLQTHFKRFDRLGIHYSKAAFTP